MVKKVTLLTCQHRFMTTCKKRKGKQKQERNITQHTCQHRFMTTCNKRKGKTEIVKKYYITHMKSISIHYNYCNHRIIIK